MYTVLLVDDEPAILSMEKRAIANRIENFKVIGEAYCVSQAKPIYEQFRPDVILTDIKMPKESGIELIKYIMSIEDNKSVCVSVSGYSDFHFVHDSFVYGAYDYLLKPVDPQKMQDLFARIERLLDSNKKEMPVSPLVTSKLKGKELVSNIENSVIKNIAGDNSILSVCNRFGISQPYLSKIFKKEKGCTYNEYLINMRIEKAKELLEKDEEFLIGEIASSLGFSDQFYFSKVFKSMTGLTPREYRNKKA
ncbi:MAG TPA: AraC family transcriptional regulator [Clostridiales bacterium]|nr:AraC family transcriptional regulator [Clostridiales bacterium]